MIAEDELMIAYAAEENCRRQDDAVAGVAGTVTEARETMIAPVLEI